MCARPNDRLPRRPCFADQNDPTKFAGHLLRLGAVNSSGAAAPKNQRCLFFDEFVASLQAAHRRGVQAELNGHFMPQDLWCPARHQKGRAADAPRSRHWFDGTVNETLGALRGLDWLPHPHAPPPHKGFSHVTAAGESAQAARTEGFWRDHAPAMRTLCELSRREYGALHLDWPKACLSH